MCLIQIVIFLFAASLSMMNDGSQGGGVMNGSTLAPLHALLILLLYYSYNPAGCSCPPYTPCSPLRGGGEVGCTEGWGVGLLPTVRPHLSQEDRRLASAPIGLLGVLRMRAGKKKKKSFLISGLEGRQPVSGTLCGI